MLAWEGDTKSGRKKQVSLDIALNYLAGGSVYLQFQRYKLHWYILRCYYYHFLITEEETEA